MKKIYFAFAVIICFLIPQFSFAQVSLTASNGNYAENFNSMGAAGTIFPAGWTAIRFAGSGTANAVLTPVVSNGSSSTGAIFNVGTTNSEERALGTLASGSTVPAFGVSFVNNTGAAITDFSLLGNAEQWRTGSNAVVESVIFEYSTDATSLSTGSWTAVSLLNLVEILTTNNANTAVDGNLSANKMAISGVISLVNLPVGATIWLRWRDADATGSDGNYALDDFQMNYTNSTGGNTISVASGVNAAEPSVNGTFTINLSAAAPSDLAITYTLGGTATLNTDYTDPQAGTVAILTGQSSTTVTLNVADDAIPEATKTITLTLGAPPAGYTIATDSASINLFDDDVAPTVSVASGANAAEPSIPGSFNITLSAAAPAGGVTINYTLAGTAILNTDYTDSLAGSITIAQGNTTGVITLTVTDDTDVEPTETIGITLNNVTNGYTIGTATASINIADNDVPPFSPISLTDSIYTQDFNTLSNTGTTNSLTIPGWQLNETGGGARDNELYAADNGSSSTGDTYSYGSTAVERALGSVRSGSLITTFGSYYINNTGTTVGAIRISYTGEQWRLGTAGRTDKLDFQYSLDATSVTTGVWTDFDQLDFTTPDTAGTGAKDGNAAGNKTALVFTITGLSIANGSTFFIRWNDADASSSDDGLSVDDFFLETNPPDFDPPVVTSFSPANAAINVPIFVTATITFNETLVKGTGQIFIKRILDDSTIQTIDVASSAVTISFGQASFDISGLANNTAYYVLADAGTFTDVNGNAFAGIIANNAWAFTTVAAPAAGVIGKLYDFAACTGSLTDGFTQFSEQGSLVWTCTTLGRNAADPLDTAFSPHAVQMNGFSGGTNVPNIDWLISPAFDLSATTFALLSFWSRISFNGAPLQLKISTDYVSGSPASAAWTDINGKFPLQGSDKWTLSSAINLSAFKQQNVHIAFVYTSTAEDGARWIADDFKIDNSAVAPPPSLTVSANDIQFGYADAGSHVDKTFVVTGNDITGNITLTASANFSLSVSSGGPFASSLTLLQASANNVSTTIFTRFSPAQNNQNFTGTITISTPATTALVVSLKGTSIDPATTLEVVNWNVEWFGSTSSGPGNNDQQQTNVQTILQNTGADLYALAEIVDESRLQAVVSNMPGYSYVICNYGSHVNPNEVPAPGADALAQAQKEAFVYKTAMFSNITTAALVTDGVNTAADLNNPAYDYFASGRYPFMMKADVTLNGVVKTIRFVVLHAKANTSPVIESYNRRKAGADTLKFTLNTLYPNDNIVLLGDINDDLDSTITDGIHPRISSYIAFTSDTAAFFSPTLALSLAGKKSTVDFNDVIDHVLLSNEMKGYYMSETANILSDVEGLVSNYGSSTSDHYPVFTRYAFDTIVVLPVITITSFSGEKDGNQSKLRWTTSQETNSKEFVIERAANGIEFESIGTVAAAGHSSAVRNYEWNDGQPLKGDNYYRLKSVAVDNSSKLSTVVKLVFGKVLLISMGPNPAKGFVDIWVEEAGPGTTAIIQVVNLSGHLQRQQASPIISGQSIRVNLAGLKGTYLIKVMAGNEIKTTKVVVE